MPHVMTFPPFPEIYANQAKVVVMVRMLTLIIQWTSWKSLFNDSKRPSIKLYLVLRSWICQSASFCTLMVTLRGTPGLSRILSLTWNLRLRMTMSGYLIWFSIVRARLKKRSKTVLFCPGLKDIKLLVISSKGTLVKDTWLFVLLLTK